MDDYIEVRRKYNQCGKICNPFFFRPNVVLKFLINSSYTVQLTDKTR